MRAAVPDDRPFLIELGRRFGATRAAWREAAEVIEGTRRQLARAVDEPRAGEAILIALDADGAAAGFAFLTTVDDFFTGEAHGHLSEIATVQDRSGAGSALLSACEAWSRTRGFRYLSLNVNDTNVAALDFYARRAYVPEYRHLVKLL